MPSTITPHTTKQIPFSIAIVTDNNDPDNLEHVKIQYPWSKENDESDWVRVSTLMAGNEQGFFFMPEVEQEVLVAFINADVKAPIIIGTLWNVNSLPPQKSDNGKNNIRKIRSRSAHEIVFDDTSGSEKISIEDKSGGKIELDTSSNKISILSSMDITIEATNIDIKASGELTLKGALIKIN